jgi:SAM-dependent methyltransferase
MGSKHLNSYIKYQDLLNFIRLVINRGKSIEDYFKFQYIQGEFLKKYLNSRKINYENFKVLDLANGYGGETQAIGNNCSFIVGLDMNIPPYPLNFPQITGDALRTPIADESFDFVISASLIEHLKEPEKLLEEISRILKPSGYVYISFPPFYSINGGHDYAPFHLFGEFLGVRFSKFIAKAFKLKRFGKDVIISNRYETAFGNWGLYIMTIRKMRNLIENSNFIIFDQTTKWLPINFSRIPILGEFFTWHVQFILRKWA